MNAKVGVTRGGGVFGALGRETPLATSLGLLVMRLAFGGTMLVAHGWPKLNAFSEMALSFPDPLGVGSPASLALTVCAEVFAAGALVLGLFTRLVSIPLAITMAVAFFAIHTDDPWKVRELAFVYMMAFVTLFFTGPGRFSIDRRLFSHSS